MAISMSFQSMSRTPPIIITPTSTSTGYVAAPEQIEERREEYRQNKTDSRRDAGQTSTAAFRNTGTGFYIGGDCRSAQDSANRSCNSVCHQSLVGARQLAVLCQGIQLCSQYHTVYQRCRTCRPWSKEIKTEIREKMATPIPGQLEQLTKSRRGTGQRLGLENCRQTGPLQSPHLRQIQTA